MYKQIRNMGGRYYVGVDGGGTRTRVFVTDAMGCRVGWGEAGIGNPHHASEEVVQRHVEEALTAACGVAGVTRSECVSVFFGMAGTTTEAGRNFFRGLAEGCGLSESRVGVDHDIRIALAGGLAGEPGIALIVGTGSSCYGRTRDGMTWQTGGWESLIADEGSGYSLGREAMVWAARMADGRTEESVLRSEVFGWLGIRTISEILPRVRESGLSRAEIAAFAPRVIALAEAGDAIALRILDQGAFLLGELVAANHRMLPTGPRPDVVITGGLGTAATFYRFRIEAAIRSQLPTVLISPAILPPVVGAALLAMEQGGVVLNPSLIENLRRQVGQRGGS